MIYRDIQSHGFMIGTYDPQDRTVKPTNEFVYDVDTVLKKVEELISSTNLFISITPGTFHRFELEED